MARGIVAVIVVVGAAVLSPELTIGRVNLNDAVFHHAIADAITQRITHGESALDFWMPEWSFGYPVLRAYQPLPAWLLAFAQLVTGQHFPLDQTFAFLRWLLIATFPLSVYAACRLIGLAPLTAAASSVVAPLISSPGLYGLEYASYLWRGNGVYTQLVAMHLFAFAIAFGLRAIRTGRALTVAGLFVALTILAHLIYGYMAAATIALFAFLPDGESSLRSRIQRLLWIGSLSFVLTAFQIVPMLSDGAYINRSRWEPAWKWDSFGLKQVLTLVATGEIVDSQRLPIVSVFVLIGAIAAWRSRDRKQRVVLAGAIVWLFLFCGPATWGPLFKVLGAGEEVQTHRFIGGLHFFFILLGGIGLARLWSISRWWIVLSCAMLVFPAVERAHYVADDVKWGRENLAAYEEKRPDIDRTIAFLKTREGRTFPGLAAMWGNQFKVGYVPFHAFLAQAHIPAIAFLYHAMALPADIMVRFDEQRPEHYRLFNIRTVVADAGRTLPAFLTPAASFGAFQTFDAPSSSAFEVVHVRYSTYADRRSFYDVNDAWLQGPWPAAGEHLLIDYESANSSLPRLPAIDAVSKPPAPRAPGADDTFVIFKSTFHPGWRAEVDGKRADVVMLSPGFPAVRLPPGRHNIRFHYEHGIAKPILLLLAFPLLLVSFRVEKRVANEEATEQKRVLSPLAIAILLTLPVIAPLLGHAMTSGHDALEYIPRLVDFHENIRHGILLPRWAPDLSSGQGQPLFLFNPPLFYYVAEFWYLIGFGVVRAINLAVVTIIVASAASMYLLARSWYGRAAGVLGAVAYLYAPYFLVDLYVRTAYAELSAFPFYPLAFFGFWRHAEDRRWRSLAIGCIGYAGVWFAHTPSAVLFSPLLGAFIVFLAWERKSVRLFATHAAAIVLALGLAAAVWVPSVVESGDTNSSRLTEGPLQYSNHFVFPRQFFSLTWGYGVSLPGDQDGMPFTLGWTQLLIAAVVVAKLFPSDRRRWLIFFAAATFAICYLMTARSHSIWDALPQLHYVAFPWRLLASATFCLAVIVGAAGWVTDRLRTIAVLAAMIILASLPHAKPASYLSIDPRQWTPQQIAERNVLAATFDTFEPRWVQARPVYQPSPFEVKDRSPDEFVATVAVANDSVVELPIAYFPGWVVKVDGANVALDPPSATGRMRVPMTRGSHHVEARFVRTPMRAAADAVSLIALFVLGSLFYADVRRRSI